MNSSDEYVDDPMDDCPWTSGAKHKPQKEGEETAKNLFKSNG